MLVPVELEYDVRLAELDGVTVTSSSRLQGLASRVVDGLELEWGTIELMLNLVVELLGRLRWVIPPVVRLDGRMAGPETWALMSSSSELQ